MHQVSRNRAPVRVIVNPAAAGGRGRKAAGLLLAELERRGVRCDAEWTRAPGHAVELAARAARDGVGRVVAVGGDGTVHEVAQGLLRDRLREASGGDAAVAESAESGGATSPAREGVAGPGTGAESAKSAESAPAVPALVLLPVGTGNDFHRMIGGPRTPDTAADLIEGGVVRRFDVGRVRWEEGERCFVNLLGVGIDVDILRLRTRFARLPGLLQYLAALLNAMAAYRPIAVEIATPERRIVARTTISVVTVGPSIGGGFMINPDARASDGWLDLCHAAAMNPLQLLGLVPKVIRGSHQSSPHITSGRIRQAAIRRQDGAPFFFEVDGELAPSAARELRVDLLAEALPVVTPDRG